MPIMQATTTAMIMAASVLISGAPDASGSTALDADDAGPTVTYVVADELP